MPVHRHPRRCSERRGLSHHHSETKGGATVAFHPPSGRPSSLPMPLPLLSVATQTAAMSAEAAALSREFHDVEGRFNVAENRLD